MDGFTLLRELRQILSEGANSVWLDTKTSYDYLWQAAIATADKTNLNTTTQAITTVASQTTYDFEPDFLKLWLTDDQNKPFIKYNNGSSTTFIYFDSYDSIVLGNNTTAVSIPNRFTIKVSDALSQITGSASAEGAVSGGECTLTVATSTFENVRAGDIIHNTTDGSNGIVLSKTSTTVIITALFDGTDNDWTSTWVSEG